MMVPAVLCVTTRRLRLGLCVCLFIATVFMMSKALQFQSFASKRLDDGDERVKPSTNGHGHGHDFQAAETIDPSVRGNPSRAAVLDDSLPVDHSSGNGTRGNSTLPHINRLQVAVDTTDPTVRESPSQAADLGDPLPADHSSGNDTRGNSTLPHIKRLQVAADATDLNVRESPSQAADLGDPLPAVRGSPIQAADMGDPFAAYYPNGISTEGNSSLPHVSGLRVAFIGDSLTRYMYLSLATYLRRGRWITKKDVPNILEEKQFNGWNLFYNYSKNSLQPNEQCDCFRPEQNVKTIENRYFTDPVQDNVLYYIQK
jgi:hypothetical protein